MMNTMGLTIVGLLNTKSSFCSLKHDTYMYIDQLTTPFSHACTVLLRFSCCQGGINIHWQCLCLLLMVCHLLCGFPIIFEIWRTTNNATMVTKIQKQGFPQRWQVSDSPIVCVSQHQYDYSNSVFAFIQATMYE